MPPKYDANKYKPVTAPAASRVSLREKLKKCVPIDRETVTVEFNGEELDIEVRSIPSGVRWRIEQEGFDPLGQMLPTRFVPPILIGSCYDPESGEPLWGEGDEAEIGSLDKDVTGPLYKVAVRLAGWGRKEDDAGNDSAGQADAGSDSVSPSDES